MSPETENLTVTIAFRVDDRTDKRIVRQQKAENRRKKGDVVRLLVIEALERRESKRRK